eukprot:TRINITY_DN12091_c0_g1_i1.p1 TRINITY_DN12091_c0_g1~~TRINITY_DN12091_c0_g1_i1.p1  ORF type:complete len:554 (+),score=151.58 TRINITY_DN12091_c0_g1_i1:32-1693(+)
MDEDNVKREPGVAEDEPESETPAAVKEEPAEDGTVKEEEPVEEGIVKEEAEAGQTEDVKDEVIETEVKDEVNEADMDDWDDEVFAAVDKKKKKKKDKKEKKSKKEKKAEKEKKKRKQADRDPDDEKPSTPPQPKPSRALLPPLEEKQNEEEVELVPKKKNNNKANLTLIESKLHDLHTKLTALQNQSASITQELKHGGKEQRFQEERQFKRWRNTKKADKRNIDERCEALAAEIKSLKAQKSDLEGPDPFKGVSQFDISNKRLTTVRVNKKADAELNATRQVTTLLRLMEEASEQDRALKGKGLPAVKKLELLPKVNQFCHRAGFQQTLIEKGLLAHLQNWLRPEGGGLPIYQIRHTILNILNNFPYVSDPGRVRFKTELGWPGVSKMDLIETELGKDIRRFANDPNETHENRTLATKLMEKWSREICQLNKNYKKLETAEEKSGRNARFKPERFVMAADVPKYYQNGDRFHADKNTDGEAAAQRCRVPQAMMPDFIKRPKFDAVPKMHKTPMQQQLERNIRKLRETRDRAMIMSIEGSASTLRPENVPDKAY